MTEKRFVTILVLVETSLQYYEEFVWLPETEVTILVLVETSLQ